MHEGTSFGPWGKEQYSYRGPDARNDAKLIAQRKRKEHGRNYTVTLKERDEYVFVVCTPTQETLDRLKAESEERARTDPYFAERSEYDYQRTPPPRREKKKITRRFCEDATVSICLGDDFDFPLPRYSRTVEGMRKRCLTDKNPGSPATHNYWYGNHGRRWAGRGKKAPKRNWKWKTKRAKQYLPH